MYFAQVIGTVWATRKDENLSGFKLQFIQPLNRNREKAGDPIVAVDTVGAGYRERVLAVSGSSARMAEGCKDTPVDTAIVGIVDDVRLD